MSNKVIDGIVAQSQHEVPSMRGGVNPNRVSLQIDCTKHQELKPVIMDIKAQLEMLTGTSAQKLRALSLALKLVASGQVSVKG